MYACFQRDDNILVGVLQFRFDINSVSQYNKCVYEITLSPHLTILVQSLIHKHPVEPKHSTSNGLLCLHSVNSVGLESHTG